MSHSLQIAVWNANGLLQHRNELQMFLVAHNIDIPLISETHFTSKSSFRIPHYITYHTNHPAGTARGGTAILIKNSIQHHFLNPYRQDYFQATSIALEGPHGLITISATLPPKHTITHELLTAFYATLSQIPGRSRLQCQAHQLAFPPCFTSRTCNRKNRRTSQL
jgi:exonuclease III